MKHHSFAGIAVSGLLSLASPAWALNPVNPPSDKPLAGETCEDVASSVKQRIKSHPATVLEIVEMEVAAKPACACEIVKAAIRATDAEPELVVSIVKTAVHVSPENMRLIAQCAIAVAPDSQAAVQKLMAELDPGTGESASSKSAKSAKDAKDGMSSKAAMGDMVDSAQAGMGGDPLNLLRFPALIPPPIMPIPEPRVIVDPNVVTQVNP